MHDKIMTIIGSVIGLLLAILAYFQTRNIDKRLESEYHNEYKKEGKVPIKITIIQPIYNSLNVFLFNKNAKKLRENNVSPENKLLGAYLYNSTGVSQISYIDCQWDDVTKQFDSTSMDDKIESKSLFEEFKIG